MSTMSERKKELAFQLIEIMDEAGLTKSQMIGLLSEMDEAKMEEMLLMIACMKHEGLTIGESELVKARLMADMPDPD